jgi:hypothetical protein
MAERRRIETAASTILQACRRNTIQQHVKNVGSLVDRVNGCRPQLAPLLVSKWKKEVVQPLQAAKILDDERAERLLDVATAASADVPVGRTLAEDFAWALTVPAADLALVHAALRAGEEVISELNVLVRDYIQRNPPSGDEGGIAAIQETGTRTARLARDLKSKLEVGS